MYYNYERVQIAKANLPNSIKTAENSSEILNELKKINCKGDLKNL